MGKSNRIRNERASATLMGVKAPQKKQGMPSWALNLITILITVVILASVAVSLIVSNGTIMRMQTAMKTDNFRVSGTMMNYYFQTQYQNFVSENSSYLSYYGLDTSLSLKEQYVDTNDESQGTWFDYMMNQTKTQVEEILIYCEEANSRDIELSDEDKEQIESELSMYETYAEMYGYTTNSYIANIFGKGMKEKDIRNAMELSALASKCAEEIGDELESAITDDEIDEEYAANALDYDLVDYNSYAFEVKYEDAIIAVLGEDYDEDDAETEENVTKILAKYEELIAKAKADAKALSEKADLDAFNSAVYTLIAEKAYDDAYKSTMTESDVASDKLPDDTKTADIRAKAIAHIAHLLDHGEAYEKVTSTENDVTKAFEIEISSEFATELETVLSSAASAANTKKDGLFVEGKEYVEADDASEWLFEEGRKVGDTDVFEKGDGADDEEIEDDVDALESNFTATVYYVTKVQYKDTTPTKNVGIMVFSTESAASEVLAHLGEGITLEEFEALCDEHGGTFSDYENYTEGSMGVAAFDTWLYGDDVTVGSYTTSVITLEADKSYALALYYEDGEEEWYVTVKGSIFSADYEAFNTEMTAKYEVITKDSVINKIDG